MDNILWDFLVNSPPRDRDVPFPWERRYDSQEEFLVYYNCLRGTAVVDLRTRVNLGDGLFHENDALNELFPLEDYPRVWNIVRQEDAPAVIVRTYNGCSYTFVIPKYIAR